MKTKRNQGFTLIELMIVIAIIGILMAYALPAYRDYTVKSKRGECNALSDGLKTLIVEYYTKHTTYPANLAALGSGVASGHFIDVTLNGNEITCAPQTAQAGTNTIEWSVTLQGSSFNWTCTDSGLPQQNICP